MLTGTLSLATARTPMAPTMAALARSTEVGSATYRVRAGKPGSPDELSLAPSPRPMDTPWILPPSLKASAARTPAAWEMDWRMPSSMLRLISSNSMLTPLKASGMSETDALSIVLSSSPGAENWPTASSSSALCPLPLPPGGALKPFSLPIIMLSSWVVPKHQCGLAAQAGIDLD
ncbi:hypothetical protein D3C86_267940 [compost metagenome]